MFIYVNVMCNKLIMSKIWYGGFFWLICIFYIIFNVGICVILNKCFRIEMYVSKFEREN